MKISEDLAITISGKDKIYKESEVRNNGEKYKRG